jgi:hypothetical protein
MTRADRVLSTPPLNTSSNKVAISTADGVDSTRRTFLVQAAAVGAGAATLGAALPLPGSAVSAGQAPDPILDAIQAHKAAYAAYGAAIDQEVDDDDESTLRASMEADRIAIELLSIVPTTAAGLIAIVEYAVTHDVDGAHWPEGLEDEDTLGRPRSWQHFLLQNVVLVALREGVAA